MDQALTMTSIYDHTKEFSLRETIYWNSRSVLHTGFFAIISSILSPWRLGYINSQRVFYVVS
jgi:hypothetical protein